MKKILIWASCVLLSGCNALNNYRTNMQPTAVEKADIKAELKKHEKLSLDAPNDAALAKNYVNFYILNAKENCQKYIKQLKESQAHRNYVRGTTSQVGGLTSALMGLASASPAVLGGTGAFFGFADTNMESYGSSYMPSPEISDILEITTKRQNEEVEKLKNTPPTTYTDARSAANDFEKICTNEGISLEIKRAIQNSKSSIDPPPK